MKKQVKKVGKYYLYKQNKQYEDQFCMIFKGKQVESDLQVMIYQIDRQKVDGKQQLEQEFKRKVSQVKLIHSRVLQKYHQISVTDHHYYIVLQQIKAPTLQKKLLNHTLNQEEIGGLLFSFKLVFEGMKKIKKYHGNITPKVIKTHKNRVKLELINLRSLDSISKIANKISHHSTKILENPDLVYYPPEAIKYNRFSEKTDCWSFGVILYNSVYGSLPWNIQGLTLSQFVHKVIYDDIEFPQIETASKQLINLMHGCLKGDEDLRFCYDDILCHQIFKSEMFEKTIISVQQRASGQHQSLSSMKTVNEDENKNSLAIKKN